MQCGLTLHRAQTILSEQKSKNVHRGLQERRMLRSPVPSENSPRCVHPTHRELRREDRRFCELNTLWTEGFSRRAASQPARPLPSLKTTRPIRESSLAQHHKDQVGTPNDRRYQNVTEHEMTLNYTAVLYSPAENIHPYSVIKWPLYDIKFNFQNSFHCLGYNVEHFYQVT